MLSVLVIHSAVGLIPFNVKYYPSENSLSLSRDQILGPLSIAVHLALVMSIYVSLSLSLSISLDLSLIQLI